jgi:hypothetical protein
VNDVVLGEELMTRQSDEYYSDLSSRLRRLLAEVSDSIESHQASEVQQFIEHSEYGLALTWLADAILESGAHTPEIVLSQISGLANVVGINQEIPEAFRGTSLNG